ncbi:MAG: rod shape-determining protein MreD [Alphaproteobacteria bacterium]|nr:rod shape-determining protein MreD [Alphaproteobacteria bacterium]
MSDELNENILSLFQRLLPFLTSVLLLFLSYVPIDFLLLNSIRPAVGLMCAFFWLQHRPDLFNLGTVFLLGLIDDLISMAPLGSNAFEMLLMYVLVNNTSRLFNAKPFVVLWYGFAILSLVAMLGRWLVVSVYYSQFLPLSMLLFSYMVTIAVYPFVSVLLAFVQNNLIKEEG